MEHINKRIHLHQTASTNTYVKELLAAGVDLPDMTLVDADYQTGGRGQKGNSWESEPGANLLFSLLIRPRNVLANRQFVISQAIALAVQQELASMVDGTTVKWSNDIYWHDRKVCGILIECTLEGPYVRDCIVGVGLNVNQETFVGDAPNPVSLHQIIGLTLDREKLLERIVARFDHYYTMAQDGSGQELSNLYCANLYRRTGFFLYQEPGGEPFEAQVSDVDSMGYLSLTLRNGEVRRYEFKQVRFIIEA